MFRSRWHRYGMAALVLGGAAAAFVRPDLAAKGAAGMAAHSICSAVFVSGQRDQQTFDQLVKPLAGPAAIAIGYRVYRDQKRVDATFAGIWSSSAQYSEGFGCRLDQDGGRPMPAGTSVAKSAPPIYESAGDLDPGLRSALDDLFLDKPGEPPKHMRAVVILHDGKLVAERYGDGVRPDTRLLSWSVAKSFTNALLGILVRQGKLHITDSHLAPEWGDKDPRSALTIEDLLRMRSGIDASEDGAPTDAVTQMLFTQSDMAAFAAAHRLKQQPGKAWEYSSANTLLLARVLGRLVGGGEAGTQDFAKRYLFAPLGISGATMEFDGAGTFIGSSYIYMSARSYARFGQLYLDDGVLPDGQRLLPEGWVAWSRTSTLGAPYGAGFWTNDGPSASAARRIAAGFPRDGFYASGIQGQRIYVIPSARLVIARFGYSSPPDFGIDDDLRLIAAAVRSTQSATSLNRGVVGH